MNTSMRLLLVLASALLVAVIALGYTSFSGAVSLDQATKTTEFRATSRASAGIFLLKVAGNLSRKEVVSLVNGNFGDGHIIKEDKDQITVDDVIFRFDGDTLISVSSLG